MFKTNYMVMFNHKNLLALLISSKVRSLWFQRWAYSLIKIFSPNVSSNSGLVSGLALWVQKMLYSWNTFTSLKSDILQAGLVSTHGWKTNYNGHFSYYYVWLADFWKHTYIHIYIFKYTHDPVLITPPSVVLGIEPGPLCMIVKASTTEPCIQTTWTFEKTCF